MPKQNYYSYYGVGLPLPQYILNHIPHQSLTFNSRLNTINKWSNTYDPVVVNDNKTNSGNVLFLPPLLFMITPWKLYNNIYGPWSPSMLKHLGPVFHNHSTLCVELKKFLQVFDFFGLKF